MSRRKELRITGANEANWRNLTAARRDLPPVVRQRIRAELAERDGPGCRACGTLKNLTVHHVKQVADGGSNDLGNLVLLCPECHRTLHQTEREALGRTAQRETTPGETQEGGHIDG